VREGPADEVADIALVDLRAVLQEQLNDLQLAGRACVEQGRAIAEAGGGEARRAVPLHGVRLQSQAQSETFRLM